MIAKALALVLSLSSRMPLTTAAQHVRAAYAAASPAVSAEMLLAVAYVETRWQHGVTSIVRGVRFCGPLQARTRSARRCAELQAPAIGYAAGAAELQAWIARAHGNVRRALLGHGCGNAGFTGRTTCGHYDRRVLAALARIGGSI